MPSPGPSFQFKIDSIRDNSHEYIPSYPLEYILPSKVPPSPVDGAENVITAWAQALAESADAYRAELRWLRGNAGAGKSMIPAPSRDFQITAVNKALKEALSRSHPGVTIRRATPRIPSIRKELPMTIESAQHPAVADSGSEWNAMTRSFAKKAGLTINKVGDHPGFRLASGDVIRPTGKTVARCSFPGEIGTEMRETFFVFKTLAAPLLMGRRFLEATETLTKHTKRLRNKIQDLTRPLCLFYLNGSGKRLRCFMDGDHVLVNPDTGSEVDLVSPSFCASKGYEIEPVDDTHRFVQLADGRLVCLQGRIKASLDIFDNAVNDRSQTKCHQRDFYVLDGLPTDILLGEDALYQMGAFTEHSESFFDFEESEKFSDLHLITWLKGVDKRIMGSLGGSSPTASETTGKASDANAWFLRVSSKIARLLHLQSNPEDKITVNLATLSEIQFQRNLDAGDIRELSRREQFDSQLANFDPRRKAEAEAAEATRRKKFDQDRDRVLQEHQVELLGLSK